MLAKTAKPGIDWDVRLPYVLFAYRATVHASTAESPFFLLYGRDPRLPVLSPPVERVHMHFDDYKQAMSEAWAQAKEMIVKAQKKQKTQHDRTSKNADFQVGDRVFVFMPAIYE